MTTIQSPPVSTILIVEDERATRLMLRRVLERAGYHVIEAADGSEALDLFQATPPAIVLLDAILPVFDGFTVCARLRKLPNGEHVPILIITALDDSQSVEEAFAAGATDYITKPVHWGVLTRRVQRLVRVYQAEQELAHSREALIHSEARFRSLVQNASDIVMIIGLEGELLYGSPSIARILGYTLEDVLGALMVDFVHPEDREKALNVFERIQTYPRTPIVAVLRVRHADNSWLYIEIVGNNLYDDPDIQGVVINARDITERKRAEEERLAVHRKLLEAQRLESLGVLAGGIAHDFNNLLAAILGHASLARSDLMAGNSPDEAFEQIERAAQRAAELTQQMLAYAGRGRFVVQQLNLNNIVDEATRLVRASITRPLEIQYKYIGQPPFFEADVAQIHQVVMNLMINAAEAIEDANGVVTVTTGVRSIAAGECAGAVVGSDLPEGMYVFLEVADTGCGMDAATLVKIFDPFFTTKFTGRGLGLAAVNGIIRGHQGGLLVQSTVGEGSVFTVLLPAYTPPSYLPPPDTVESAAVAVLVVDDEAAVRKIAARALSSSGFQVFTAADGQTALDVFNANKSIIDCVLIDLTMPHMSGEQLIANLRQIKPDVRMLLMSGYSEYELRDRFASQKIAGFLQKPFTPADLRALLRQVMART